MEIIRNYLLSLIVFLPLAGAAAVLFIPKAQERAIRIAAAIFSGLALLLSIYLFARFDRATSGMQFMDDAEWIRAFGIQYLMGVDGLSAPLVMLTALLSFLSVLASFSIKLRVKEYFFFFMLLETGMLGVFCALDFFLFYVFWEVMLVPMYFLIGIWGGPQKEYAAIKFFLYTLFGSVIMLLAILALYFKSDPRSFSMLALKMQAADFGGRFGFWVFLGFFIGFAIKVPIFPFHTWLPLAHVEAPTAVSVILAGVLLKMGAYGILRVNYTLLPEASRNFAWILALLGLINIVYGAFCAMAQRDLKKMVAYSSVNHMGYCLLGMAAMTTVGFTGATLQMVTHGIITGSLFLLVGVIYDRAHTRDIDAFGGLGVRLPVYAGLMTVAAMASLGLPGLAGFVSEFACFLGGFNPMFSVGRIRLFTILSVTGIVITAGFFLLMIQKVFLGAMNEKWSHLPDMNAREIAAIAPLIALTILLGVAPFYAVDLMNSTMAEMARWVALP